jgi:hypothetical protein
MPFQVDGHGWELLVKRLGLQHGPGDLVRTYGAYQVYIDGNRVVALSGHICECRGVKLLSRVTAPNRSARN